MSTCFPWKKIWAGSCCCNLSVSSTNHWNYMTLAQNVFCANSKSVNGLIWIDWLIGLTTRKLTLQFVIHSSSDMSDFPCRTAFCPSRKHPHQVGRSEKLQLVRETIKRTWKFQMGGVRGAITEATPEQFCEGVWLFPGRVHTTSNASVHSFWFSLKHCHENTVILMFYGVIQAHPRNL